MFGPTVYARIEKTHKLPGLPIERTQVCAFMPVAAQAGTRQIFEDGLAAVFAADDVVYLAAEMALVIVQQAVFAEELSALRDLQP